MVPPTKQKNGARKEGRKEGGREGEGVWSE